MLTLNAAEMCTRPIDVRRQLTTDLFMDMTHRNSYACVTFAGMVDEVIVSRSGGSRRFEEDDRIQSYLRSQRFPSYGVFVTKAATSFITDIDRSVGYLRAIAREPSADVIIDAGCGAGAFLGLAAAAHHPSSEVICIEKNAAAAECAREVVELCGLSDRVKVEAGDAMNFPLPKADLAISETFGQVLRTENGPAIMRRLSGESERILPRFARVYAADRKARQPEDWQVAGDIDFREFNGVVSGTFYSRSRNFSELYVRVGFLDEEKGPVVDITPTAGTIPPTVICEPTLMRRIFDEFEVGTAISFDYEAGRGDETQVNYSIDK